MLDVTASTTYSIQAGLETGKLYKFRVRAQNEIGYSKFSDETFAIAAKVPEPPTKLSLISSSDSAIFFEWQAPYNGGSMITYYKIYWDNGIQD